METKEILSFNAEIKALPENNGTFEGYASVFGNIDSHFDIVEKGAFQESLNKKGLPSLLWQHDFHNVIGKYTEAREDEHGLYVKGELNLDVQKGKEAYALLKQGALKGLSIGFITKEEDYHENIRLLKKVELMEVSIVTFPSNRQAQVLATRNQPATIRDFEAHLREVGFSNSQAKLIASKGFQAFEQEQREVSGQNVEILKSLNQLNLKIKELTQ